MGSNLSALNAIEVCGFRFAYPDGTDALRDIGIAIAVGERVALLGANGAGKSTLLLAMGAILRGTGTVRILGTEVERSTVAAIRRRIGLVFQDPDDQLFLPTILDDVAFGPLNAGASRGEADRVASETLAAVGLADLAPKPASRLSHGQRKRAALATALAMRPEILLLDEPTSGLDAVGRREAIAFLARREQTLVFSTHDLDLTAEIADRIVVLEEGRIACDGPASELLSRTEFFDRHGLRPGDAYLRLMALLAR
jgi:cobalt/nickel transport system ATP-binding protein